jgi:hypothetical protein
MDDTKLPQHLALYFGLLFVALFALNAAAFQ